MNRNIPFTAQVGGTVTVFRGFPFLNMEGVWGVRLEVLAVPSYRR